MCSPPYIEDSEDLAQLFTRLLAEGVPRRAIRNLPEVDRAWSSRPAGPPVAALDVQRSERLPCAILAGAQSLPPPKRSRSAVRGWQGKFPSRKLGRTVRARSHLELRYVELLELDPAVRNFVEQPARLAYADGQKRRSTIPDFFVEWESGCAFVEIKWEQEASNSKNEARWPLIGAAFNELGFNYLVVTERTILREPRSSNLATLLRLRRQDPPAQEIIDLVRGDDFRHLRSLEEVRAAHPGVDEVDLLRLVSRGILRVDLDQSFFLSEASDGRPAAGGI